jgi:hypothetical protein
MDKRAGSFLRFMATAFSIRSLRVNDHLTTSRGCKILNFTSYADFAGTSVAQIATVVTNLGLSR